MKTKISVKFLLILLTTTIALTSCGRKGALEYPGEKKRPNFDKVIDEE